MKIQLYKNFRLIIIVFLFSFLFLNISFLYLGVSCKNLSPEQQCSCYEIKQNQNSKYKKQYLKTCSQYRVIND